MANRRSGIPPPPRPAFLVERLPTSHSSSPPQPQAGGPQPTRHALQICSLPASPLQIPSSARLSTA
uniref:Uncharacterized protein n=1 Tax=Kalanchoe fedtschenkoi TaxID=63787 RepID=A0A7N0ZRS1_KALFE